MSEDNPTTVKGWIEYYKARGQALEGVCINPETGELVDEFDVDPGWVSPAERAFLDKYKLEHPELAKDLL